MVLESFFRIECHGDIEMLATKIEDDLWMLVPNATVKKMAKVDDQNFWSKSVTNILKLTPIHFVSIIRQRDRCHRVICLDGGSTVFVVPVPTAGLVGQCNLS